MVSLFERKDYGLCRCGDLLVGTLGRRWSRQVRDANTGALYPNVKEAAKALGVSETAIYRRLNREHKYRTGDKVNVMWGPKLGS